MVHQKANPQLKLFSLSSNPEIAKKIAEESKGEIVVRIENGYPYLENNPVLTEQTRTILKEMLGTENVIDLPTRMTGEDFSFFAQKIPATFIRLGVRNEAKGIVHGVHNVRYNIDDDALAIGVRTLLSICFNSTK